MEDNLRRKTSLNRRYFPTDITTSVKFQNVQNIIVMFPLLFWLQTDTSQGHNLNSNYQKTWEPGARVVHYFDSQTWLLINVVHHYYSYI